MARVRPSTSGRRSSTTGSCATHMWSSSMRCGMVFFFRLGFVWRFRGSGDCLGHLLPVKLSQPQAAVPPRCGQTSMTCALFWMRSVLFVEVLPFIDGYSPQPSDGHHPRCCTTQSADQLVLQRHSCTFLTPQVFLTNNHLNIVMEYANGGSLFDHVKRHRRLSEKDARCAVSTQLVYFADVWSAVEPVAAQHC